jgi:hypothetical protein
VNPRHDEDEFVPESRTSIVWIELGSIALGVTTDDLLGIRARTTDDDETLDLDGQFACAFDESRPVRVLDLVGDVHLATRAHVFIDEGSSARIHPLPSFVAPWGAARGVISLAARDADFGWIIEPRTWAESFRREPPRGPQADEAER